MNPNPTTISAHLGRITFITEADKLGYIYPMDLDNRGSRKTEGGGDRGPAASDGANMAAVHWENTENRAGLWGPVRSLPAEGSLVEVSEEQVDGEGRGEHDGATTRSPPQRVEENSHHQASTSEGGFGEGRGVFWLGVDPERGGGLAQLQPSAEPICIPEGP
ncbi:unnamed protein product [Gadus morhua 'NCC']